MGVRIYIEGDLVDSNLFFYQVTNQEVIILKDDTNSKEKEFEVAKEWIKETPREDHRVISRALENPLRRKIMKFIGLNSEKKFNEISEEFNLHKSEAKTHLSFLKEAKIVKVTNENPLTYKLDEIGKKYLENVEKVKK